MKKSVLLFGISNVGKTTIAKIIAGEIRIHIL